MINSSTLHRPCQHSCKRGQHRSTVTVLAAIVTIGVVVLVGWMPNYALAASTADGPVTPVAEAPELLAQLRSALKDMGAAYEPRTEHFTSDNQPTYLNRLILERSPYLLQHAHNPVNWFPWGPEAFGRAKENNKPIFLSVGYATCHWCHVMEKESFENEGIARYLNEYFVTIKVDREQRPDVDSTFMTTVQMLTGSGGWPMSVFLTPEGKPFFGGTYFPPQQFEDLLKRVDQVWLTQQPALEEEAEKISAALASRTANQGTATKVGQQVIADGIELLLENFDSFEGGFGGAPKFPRAPMLFLLLDQAQRSGDSAAIEALDFTLQSIAAGGIHDQIGGGFHRYAVDSSWLTPHFEKMLYNQALLARLYTQTYLLTDKPEHARTATRTLDYLLRDMQAENGGFYSATDADSDSGEGHYFIWDSAEIDKLLGNDADFANQVWNITEEGNFDDSNILHLSEPYQELAASLKLSTAAFTEKLNRVSDILLEQRNNRQAPLRDEKILTGWNGLVITALAEGGIHLQQPQYIVAAENTAEFLWENNRRKENGDNSSRLFRSYYLGTANIDGNHTDYAYLAEGFIALYDATQKSHWLQRAQQLVHAMDEEFKDASNGGYFMGKQMTGGVELPTRPKEMYDNSLPSGNSTTLRVLVQLWHRTGDFKYQEAANEMISSFSPTLSARPNELGYMVKSTSELLNGEAGSIRYAGFGKVRAQASVDSHNKIRVSIDIAPGWHINSIAPRQKYLIGTSLTGADGEALVNTTYPTEKLTKLKFENSELSLYDGSIEITAEIPKRSNSSATPLTTKKGAETDAELEKSSHAIALYPLELQIQTCSDEICLAPETVTINASVANSHRQ